MGGLDSDEWKSIEGMLSSCSSFASFFFAIASEACRAGSEAPRPGQRPIGWTQSRPGQDIGSGASECRVRRKGVIADGGDVCRSWADSAPAEVASGRTRVRGIAVVRLRARIGFTSRSGRPCRASRPLSTESRPLTPPASLPCAGRRTTVRSSRGSVDRRPVDHGHQVRLPCRDRLERRGGGARGNAATPRALPHHDRSRRAPPQGPHAQTGRNGLIAIARRASSIAWS